MERAEQQSHIVLVHGACHGAWCWYKLKPMLEAASHRVTALDLSASGINPKSLHELNTLAEYTQPLLELLASIPGGEKVILVGHSLGGMNLGLAMDTYPEKISVAVFLTAFMPDSVHRPSYVLEKHPSWIRNGLMIVSGGQNFPCKLSFRPNEYNEQTSTEEWLDTEFLPYGTVEEPRTSMFFGPNFLSSKLYQLCSPEDVALANMLIRPSSLFMEDLSKKDAFSNERFGSVKRVYIVCNEDKAVPVNFLSWLIETIGVAEVKEIKDADHMAMLSKPKQLCRYLLEIATKYN